MHPTETYMYLCRSEQCFSSETETDENNEVLLVIRKLIAEYIFYENRHPMWKGQIAGVD